MTKTGKLRLPIRRLSKSTNRRSQFLSHTHCRRALKLLIYACRYQHRFSFYFYEWKYQHRIGFYFSRLNLVMCKPVTHSYLLWTLWPEKRKLFAYLQIKLKLNLFKRTQPPNFEPNHCSKKTRSHPYDINIKKYINE